MRYIFIKSNELDGHKISYEYVTRKKKLQEILKDYKTIKLNNIAKEITSGIRIKKEYYSEQGYAVIAPGDIRNGEVHFGELRYIKSEVIKDKDLIISGDILITAAGRSGQILYVNDELEGCTITSDIIKVRVTNTEKGLKVYSFLKSGLGQMMLDTIKTGLINKILVEDVEELLIPQNFEMDETNNNETLELKKQAAAAYKNAEDIFYKFIDYKGEEEKKKQFYIYKYLDSNRLDPDYYTNFFTELYSVINNDTRNIEWQNLRQIAEVKVAVKPEISDDKEVQYFTLSDVDEKLSVIKEVHQGEYGKLSNRMRYVVRDGEIITAKSGSSTGTEAHATAIITKEFDGMITTDAFFNMIPINIDKYYLLFLFKQPVLINQINMISKGTIYKLVQKLDFENIRIPRLKNDAEEAIGKKVKEYISIMQRINE